MAFRLLPVRKKCRTATPTPDDVEEKKADESKDTAPARQRFVVTDAFCEEYMRWEAGLAAKPLKDCPDLAPDVFLKLKVASEAGDDLAAALYSKACLVKEAKQRAQEAVLAGSIRSHFRDVAARRDWREHPTTKEVFSTVDRTFCGGRVSAFTNAVASAGAEDSLHASISSNGCVKSVTQALLAEELPELTIDMALVSHEGGVCSRGATECGEPRFVGTEDVGTCVHRAHVPLRFPRDVKLSQFCPPELLLVLGCMLVPLDARRHAWKTLIVVSGHGSKCHLMDRVCADFVGLGVATDLKTVLSTSASHPRHRPFVLKLEQWNAGNDERVLDDLHAVLKIGVVVVIRNDVGVPKEICAQPRLRLCTTHVRDVVVTSEEAWTRGRGLLFTEALKEYTLHAAAVPVPCIPFRNVIQGAAYRPVPRRGMNTACFYMTEMIQMQYGFGFGERDADFTVGLEYVTEALHSYALRRKVFEVSRAVTVEDVLQAASCAREDRHAAVTYVQELKIFRNLVRFGEM